MCSRTTRNRSPLREMMVNSLTERKLLSDSFHSLTFPAIFFLSLSHFPLRISTLIHIGHSSVRLNRILVIMRARSRHTSIQLFQPLQIHGRSQQWHDIRVKRLPVRVVEVVLLRLSSSLAYTFAKLALSWGLNIQIRGDTAQR
jgi:hypothetical protein